MVENTRENGGRIYITGKARYNFKTEIYTSDLSTQEPFTGTGNLPKKIRATKASGITEPITDMAYTKHQPVHSKAISTTMPDTGLDPIQNQTVPYTQERGAGA